MIFRYIVFSRRRRIFLFAFFSSLFLLSAIRFPHSRITAYFREPPKVLLIQTEYPGAHPEKTEKKITEPLEESLYGTSGISELESYSETGRSEIRIFFHENADIRKSELEIRERVENAFRRFPSDVRYPSIENFRRENSPDMILKVEKSGYEEERQFAETVLKPEILKEKSVSGISIYGGAGWEFLISVSPEKLRKYSLSAEEILGAVRKSRVQSRITGVQYNDKVYNISIKSAADTEDLISGIPVLNSKGRTVFLKDVSEVHYSKTRPTSVFRRNGREETAVYIHFADHSGASQVRKILSQEKFQGRTALIYDRSEAEKKEWFSVFSTVSLLCTVIFFLKMRKRRTVFTGISGGLLTFFILISFSEKFTIPDFYSVFIGIFIVSIGIRWNTAAVFMLLLSGAGFVLSGFLENFSLQKLQIVLFLKLLFSGLLYLGLSVYIRILCRSFGLERKISRMQRFNKVFHFIISYTLFSSALLADSVWKFLLKYRSVIPSPVCIAGAAASAFLSVYAEYHYLQTKISFAFAEKTSAVTANLELPSGFSLSASERAAGVLEGRLLRLPELETYSLSENDHSSVTVRTEKSINSKKNWIHQLKETAGKTEPAYLYFQTEEGASPEEELTFDVYGSDFIKMNDFISESLRFSSSLNGVLESVYRYKPAREEILFRLDREKLASLNISEAAPGETLRLYMEGSVIGKVFVKGKNRDLRIELDKKEREEYKDFLNLPVFSRDGIYTESGRILFPEQSSVPVRIQHRNKNRVLSFSVRLSEEGEKNKEEIAGRILERKSRKDIRMEIRKNKENDLIIKLKKLNSGRFIVFLFFGAVFSFYLHSGRRNILKMIFSEAENKDCLTGKKIYAVLSTEILVSLIAYSMLPLIYCFLGLFLPCGAVLEILHIFLGAVPVMKFKSSLKSGS